ncbi:MAG: DedA family protein [Candidatus Saccharimonadales bacterium]
MNQIFTLLDLYSDKVQLFVSTHVVLAPLLLLLAEEMGVPILVPGDAILGYVGYDLAKTHSATLWQAFILAFISVLIGASVLFLLSQRYGNFVITRLGQFIFLKQKHLDHAEKLFAKYGIWTIIFGRHIPGMRIPITIFAATSGVKYRTFMLGTVISTSAWILFYLSVGKSYGSDIQHSLHKYVVLSFLLIITVILVIVGLHILGHYRERKERS